MVGQRLGQVHRLPGGATAEESWATSGSVSLLLKGEIDSYDKHELVDLLTSCVLCGARDIVIDASALDFLAVSSLRTFAGARRFLCRVGGTLDVVGLRPAHRQIWREMRARQGRCGRAGIPALRLAA